MSRLSGLQLHHLSPRLPRGTSVGTLNGDSSFSSDPHVFHFSLVVVQELWAATEEQSEAKKNAKKSKNKKKKAKKKAKQQQEEEKQTEEPAVAASTKYIAAVDEDLAFNDVTSAKVINEGDKDPKDRPTSPSFDDEEDDNNVVDFVLYLQQTGSIIALAKLMDALEYGDEDELNDYERRMIREQKQMLRAQPTHPAH